jgi:hypothetical protein
VFVMMGIDPHTATDTAVAVDGDEYVIDEFTLRSSNDQVERLTGWADRFTKREWAVESASGFGYLISQELVACGETVFDVPAVLASRVKRHRDVSRLRNKHCSRLHTSMANSRQAESGERSVSPTHPGSSTGSPSPTRRPGTEPWLPAKSLTT